MLCIPKVFYGNKNAYSCTISCASKTKALHGTTLNAASSAWISFPQSTSPSLRIHLGSRKTFLYHLASIKKSAKSSKANLTLAFMNLQVLHIALTGFAYSRKMAKAYDQYTPSNLLTKSPYNIPAFRQLPNMLLNNLQDVHAAQYSISTWATMKE